MLVPGRDNRALDSAGTRIEGYGSGMISMDPVALTEFSGSFGEGDEAFSSTGPAAGSCLLSAGTVSAGSATGCSARAGTIAGAAGRMAVTEEAGTFVVVRGLIFGANGFGFSTGWLGPLVTTFSGTSTVGFSCAFAMGASGNDSNDVGSFDGSTSAFSGGCAAIGIEGRLNHRLSRVIANGVPEQGSAEGP